MPGMLGFTAKPYLTHIPQQTLADMRALMTHTPGSIHEELFWDGAVVATASRTSAIQKRTRLTSHSNCHVWLDGEFYNASALKQTFGVQPDLVLNDAELLLQLYLKQRNFSFLREIDGLYAAVVYDADCQKLHLISDRYGLRPLYWTVFRESLVWSSELKTLLALPSFQPQIDPLAVEDFLGLRYLIGNRTWFKNVELLPAATVLSWNLSEQSLHQTRYWWWDQIAPLEGGLTVSQIADQLGEYFIAAVKQQSLTPEKVGLTLSGGLDSRAILAAMPDLGYPIQAVTYGKAGCEDLRLATRVAKLKPARLHTIQLDSENWLASRLPKIWETDGSCSLIHLQFISALDLIREKHLFEVILHGSGAALIKGSNTCLFNRSQLNYHVEKVLNLNGFSRSSQHHASVLERFNAYFDSIGACSHTLHIDSRIRSFLLKDSKLSTNSGIECRLPFLNNALQEFLYAVPNQLKTNNQLYSQMLLRHFPKFYQTIPRQGTGEPISPPGLLRKTRKFGQRLTHKLQRELKPLGIVLPTNLTAPRNQDFYDYTAWMRQEPARSLFENAFKNPSARYSEFLDQDQVLAEWTQYLNGGASSFDRLGQVFTLETWLQQLASKSAMR